MRETRAVGKPLELPWVDAGWAGAGAHAEDPQMATVENELLSLERQYWQAIKDKDAETVRRLTDYPCIVAGAQGVAQLDESTYKAMLSGPWDLKTFDLDRDAQVRQLSDDVAIIAYKVREELTVDDKPVSLEAADTSVWVRRNGSWRCAAHTESLSGDPYGRDRRH